MGDLKEKIKEYDAQKKLLSNQNNKIKEDMNVLKLNNNLMTLIQSYDKENEMKNHSSNLRNYVITQSIEKCKILNKVNSNNTKISKDSNLAECIRVYSDILNKKIYYNKQFIDDKESLYKSIENNYLNNASSNKSSDYLLDSQYYGIGSLVREKNSNFVLDGKDHVDYK